MQRQRIKRADRVETAMRRAAPAHIVFRVDFEKPEARTRVEDRLEMLGLEPDADARRGQDPRSMTIGDGHGRFLEPCFTIDRRWRLRGPGRACYIERRIRALKQKISSDL